MFVAGLICFFNAALRSAQEGLRRSEINFRSLVTHAPYGVCRCDSSGILLDVNPALVAMLGYETGSELVGRNLANLYSDSQQWFSLADYLRSLQKFQGLAADWVRKDGTSISVRLSGRAFRDERQRPSSSNSSPRTSPSAAPWSSNSARPRRWRRSAGWPAASLTTSTTC